MLNLIIKKKSCTVDQGVQRYGFGGISMSPTLPSNISWKADSAARFVCTTTQPTSSSSGSPPFPPSHHQLAGHLHLHPDTGKSSGGSMRRSAYHLHVLLCSFFFPPFPTPSFRSCRHQIWSKPLQSSWRTLPAPFTLSFLLPPPWRVCFPS